MIEFILIEIVAVPAERSRGRHNPRVVKRKMSSFPTKARAAPASRQVFRYEAHIQVVAPLGSPERQPPPTAAPKNRPRTPRSPASGRTTPGLEHVRAWRASGLSRTAYCERHHLNLCAFHQWVARARPIIRRKRRLNPS